MDTDEHGAAMPQPLPLPARNEWGEGWGEGKFEPRWIAPPHPCPLLRYAEERELQRRPKSWPSRCELS